MMKKLLLGLTTVALLAAPFGSARASLILSSVQDQTAYGFGTVQTLLSLQAQAQNQTEQGCRAWQPAGDDPVLGAYQNDGAGTPWAGNVINGGNFCAEGSANDVPSGTPKTTLPSLSSAGITSISEIGLLFNANQISSAGITLNALVLSFYTATGDVIFSATLAPNFCTLGSTICSGANTFAFSSPGQGAAGFLFVLDAAQQAALLAAMGGTFNGNILVGSSAVAGCAGSQTANCKEANDGAESISLIRTATTTTVPEPSSAALVATGLIGLARFARRRRRQG